MSTEFNTARSKLRSVMWSVFNDARVEEPESEYILFSVPQYRLAVFGVYNESLISEYTQNDWRTLLVSPLDSESMVRNKILDYIDMIDIRYNDTGTPLLRPKMQGDAGWDIITNQDMVCEPGVGTDIPTDLYLALPNHIYGVIQARSSTSKKRLLVLPGIIDAGYRGQIFIMTYNLTNIPIIVRRGERIGQMLFFKRVMNLDITYQSQLRPSDRGTNGFGSTGS